MERDPLRETLDGLLSADAPAPAAPSAPLPAAIEAVCRALADEAGISDVRLGRQVRNATRWKCWNCFMHPGSIERRYCSSQLGAALDNASAATLA